MYTHEDVKKAVTLGKLKILNHPMSLGVKGENEPLSGDVELCLFSGVEWWGMRGDIF